MEKKTESGVKIVVEMESKSLKAKRLLKRTAELKRIVGLKQLEIDYLTQLLTQLIELESASVGYDIKKSTNSHY